MTKNLLLKARELFSKGGEKKKAVETRLPYFNPSEIDSLKQQVQAANAVSLAERKKRGHKVNTRILAARAAGANI